MAEEWTGLFSVILTIIMRLGLMVMVLAFMFGSWEPAPGHVILAVLMSQGWNNG